MPEVESVILFPVAIRIATSRMIFPKVRMVSVDVNFTYDEVLAVFKECMYTRLPVYEDEKENIIGVINMKDFIALEDHENFKVRDIMREALYTHEFKKTQDLLAQMRKETSNIVFVLNEYGTIEGMITLEDLLEEIVGEIRDDVNDALDLKLDSEEYDSIGGIVIEHLDHLPQDGEEVVLEDGTVLKVLGMDQKRIEEVEITLPEPVEDEAQAEESEEVSEKAE